jgi:hypothetical protein
VAWRFCWQELDRTCTPEWSSAQNVRVKTNTSTRLALSLLSLGALSQVSATDLRLYQNFAEVRMPVTAPGETFTIDLATPMFGGLYPGTLDLEGLKYTQAATRTSTRTTNWLSTQEGKPVVLREDGKAQTVTLIRAADLLIRDAGGIYRPVKLEQLGFSTLPPAQPVEQKTSRELVFTLANPGSGTLSYLTGRLNWSPRFTLVTAGKSATLSALADISNGSAYTFKVSNAELFAGQVELRTRADNTVYNEASADFAAPIVAASRVAAPSISAGAAANGLYRFKLAGPFNLPAGETLTLPFAAPQISEFVRYASLGNDNQNWRPDSFQLRSSGVLERGYRFRTGQNLPGGLITVRDEGRVAGQAELTETASGQMVDVTLGRDPDVRYTRSVELLSTERRNTPSREIDTFKVTYTFESSKTVPWPVEVNDYFRARKLDLSGAELSGNGYATTAVTVPAGGKVTKSFTVVLNNE